MLAFGLRGDVRVVGPGSAKGSKHLSSDLLWSTHDSVMHAVWFYSLWKCILTSKCSRRSCPRRLLPLIFCVLPYSGNQKRKTHRIWPTLFWGPGPLRSSPMVRVRVGAPAPTCVCLSLPLSEQTNGQNSWRPANPNSPTPPLLSPFF